MKKILMFSVMLIFGYVNFNIIRAQFDCGHVPDTASFNFSTNPFQGYLKPNRTDSINGVELVSDAFFPVLIVFVQFKNQANDPRDSWPMNLPPVYLDNMISIVKKTTGDWWNYYNENTEIFSDHWMEISRGKLHIVSPSPTGKGAFSVVLAFDASHYDSIGGYLAERTINAEIWDSLRAQGLIDWREYDKWKYDQNGNFTYERDSVVDMIYKIHKSRNSGGLIDNSGYAGLAGHSNNFGFEVIIDPTNDIKINYSTSGVTASFQGQLAQYIGTLGHEHGHFMFSSAHSTYSRVSFGLGFEFFYSPADMILNGYMSPTNAVFNSINYLGDYSSRNSGTGNLLKVPVQGNEYFILASRNKYSKWDRVMTGDVAQIDPYNDNSEYGKGLYIYHVANDLNYPQSDISQQDMECADGLFEWEYSGQSAQQIIYDCFISGANDWYYYKKKRVIYENDSSNLFRQCITSSYTPRAVGDGISLRYYQGCNENKPILHYKWWGEGEQPTNSCDIGTDRLFTNTDEIYTRFDIGGDRYDPWKLGYNEVFSPYSSPNTNTWSDEYSGIFIHYDNYSGNVPGEVASIRIYKAGEGGYTDSSILQITPPSRPMGLTVMPCDSQPSINGYKRIKLKWNHNMEPDMERTLSGEEGLFKRYKIYRSAATDMGSVPDDALAYSENYYDLIATVNINKNSNAVYTDEELISICNTEVCTPPNYCIEYPVRYRVQAVDKYDDVSVLSDFVNTRGGSLEAGSGNRNASNETEEGDSELPVEYSLSQNYPNPFNPETNIKYELPFGGLVTLRIYDILGKEVLTLINEYKDAGRYITGFNGSDMSSGIYYYTIRAGGFTQTKRMILLK
ncbi:MAG TPA: T9SS type A sorting domain-containing protein [Ignavibacteria bacterium]|nr:T9SS type A sorting domain-containing protein [Ignavibacteria bacterium]